MTERLLREVLKFLDAEIDEYNASVLRGVHTSSMQFHRAALGLFHYCVKEWLRDKPDMEYLTAYSEVLRVFNKYKVYVNGLMFSDGFVERFKEFLVDLADTISLGEITEDKVSYICNEMFCNAMYDYMLNAGVNFPDVCLNYASSINKEFHNSSKHPSTIMDRFIGVHDIYVASISNTMDIKIKRRAIEVHEKVKKYWVNKGLPAY